MRTCLAHRGVRLPLAFGSHPVVRGGQCLRAVPRASLRDSPINDANVASTSSSHTSTAAAPALAASVALLLLSEGPAWAAEAASPFEGVTANSLYVTLALFLMSVPGKLACCTIKRLARASHPETHSHPETNMLGPTPAPHACPHSEAHVPPLHVPHTIYAHTIQNTHTHMLSVRMQTHKYTHSHRHAHAHAHSHANLRHAPPYPSRHPTIRHLVSSEACP